MVGSRKGSETAAMNGAVADSSVLVAETLDFSSREEVERLLNEKMKGKNKTDYKGKAEQMMEYIKKLRSCVKWFQAREEELISLRDELQKLADSLEKRFAEHDAKTGEEIKELRETVKELTERCTCLMESLEKEQGEKLAAVDKYVSESEERRRLEKSKNDLSEELKKTQQAALTAEQQVMSLQDMNKSLQEYNSTLQAYSSKLQNDATVNVENISRLHKEKAAMIEELSSLKPQLAVLQDQLSSLKASEQAAVRGKEELRVDLEQLRGELKLVREDRESQLVSVQSLSADLAKYKEFSGKSSAELAGLVRKNETLEATCSAQTVQIHLLQTQLQVATEKLKLADTTAVESRTACESQQRLVTDLTDRLSRAEQQILEAERLRKKMHNTIQELKGNIRVFCRVRPLQLDVDDPEPDPDPETSVFSFPTSMEFVDRGVDLLHNGQTYSFTFDRVFGPKASQDDVFTEISQLVQSALDGYKVCIFAYGQTGSGKTYTMMGRPEDPEQEGLIPRSLEQIFEAGQSLSSQGWKYKTQASMLEIYNESIRDLLATGRSNGCDGGSSSGKQYQIKHDQNGNTVVSDLTVVDVCSIQEVSYLLRRASQSRSVGWTQMNEQSSRSHFVFTLRISGVNEITGQRVQGVLNLIDLAGSERLGKSGSTGERLKETQSINRSLSALGDVIFAIAKKDDHVPYRNSKLTYLLQTCLGGDSKTLMFVNVAPESSSTGESICSLRFASRVNACEIGVPRRQTQTRPLDSRLSFG
ncbi:kinesin-like protein KIN-14H [Wolffia australiana]